MPRLNPAGLKTHADVAAVHAFVASLPAARTVGLLIELALEIPAVHARLARLQLADRPIALAAKLRDELRALQDELDRTDPRHTGHFPDLLAAWVEHVTNELAPRHPHAALRLIEAFFARDRHWFESIDIWVGDVGYVMDVACRCWLDVAARCRFAPHMYVERMLLLWRAADYGGRDSLIVGLAKLPDSTERRAWVDELEARIEAGPDGRPPGFDTGDERHLRKLLLRLADALGDTDMRARIERPGADGVQLWAGLAISRDR